MTTMNTPTCILEAIQKAGLIAQEPHSREDARLAILKAVTACETHKARAEIKAKMIVLHTRPDAAT